jgi:hypothetical protein
VAEHLDPVREKLVQRIQCLNTSVQFGKTSLKGQWLNTSVQFGNQYCEGFIASEYIINLSTLKNLSAKGEENEGD